jgi:hypothetical protein
LFVLELLVGVVPDEPDEDLDEALDEPDDELDEPDDEPLLNGV